MGRAAIAATLILVVPGVLAARDPPHQVVGRNYVEGVGRAWVQGGLDRAASRLREPTCRLLFEEFTSADGEPLARRLQALGVTPEEYLTRWIWFLEGSRLAQCRSRDVAAVTQVGSRVVYVCSARVVADHLGDGDAVLIHEMLHSLGLPESPPSPAAITRRVRDRCLR